MLFGSLKTMKQSESIFTSNVSTHNTHGTARNGLHGERSMNFCLKYGTAGLRKKINVNCG